MAIFNFKKSKVADFLEYNQVMSNKQWPVPEPFLAPILSYYSARMSGATLSRQGYYPSEFQAIGINKRDASRNFYYGMVVTIPPNHEDKLVFGFSYLDTKDNQTDEDIYVLDVPSKQIEYFPKGSYEKENSLYVGTHKGIKDYLLPGVT